MLKFSKITQEDFDKTGISLIPDAVNAAISKKKQVGAVVMAWDNSLRDFRFFSGSNLWFSESYAADHAEQFAVKKALFARCYPLRIYVSSGGTDGDAIFLCGLCKEFVSSINRDCEIIVVDPDGGVKGRQILSEEFKSKNFKNKNDYFKELCDFSNNVEFE